MNIPEVRNEYSGAKLKTAIQEVIRKAVLDLYIDGEVIENPRWQSVDTIQSMFEIRHQFLKMNMPSTKEALQSQCKADQPWEMNIKTGLIMITVKTIKDLSLKHLAILIWKDIGPRVN